MPYAIKADWSYRAVDEVMTLEEDETLYGDIPQWVYDRIETNRINAELTGAEDSWRISEMEFIADQLIAMEDDDPEALPGTERQWRDYRTLVRGWKEGHPDFPNAASRPVRPA
jgi:hypothetical protein